MGREAAAPRPGAVILRAGWKERGREHLLGAGRGGGRGDGAVRRGAAGQVGERARAELRARGESLPLIAECGPRPSRPSESPIRVAHPNRPSESPSRVAYRVADPSRPSESPIRVDPASCGPVAGSRRGVRLPPCLLDTRFAGISASFPRLVGAFSASFPRCSIFSASFRRLFSVFPASLQHLFRVFSEPFPRLFRVSSASFPRLFGAFPASCRRLFRAFSASFPRVRERPDFRAGPKAMSGCKAVSPPPHPPPFPATGSPLARGKVPKREEASLLGMLAWAQALPVDHEGRL